MWLSLLFLGVLVDCTLPQGVGVTGRAVDAYLRRGYRGRHHRPVKR